MTRAARSVYVFGIYLIVAGGVLIGSPNTLLAILQLPPTTEPWVHVLGIPVMSIGMLHVSSARADLVPFFRASVWVRFFVLAALTVLAALRLIPPILIGLGVIDAAGATWTRIALREALVVAGQVSQS